MRKIIAVFVLLVLLLSVIPGGLASVPQEEYSDAFKAHMDAEGNFIIKRYHPLLDNDEPNTEYRIHTDMEVLFYEFTEDRCSWFQLGLDGDEVYDKNSDQAWVIYYEFEISDGRYDLIKKEKHFMNIRFVYDPQVKADADKMIAKLPQNHTYQLSDMELLNFWMHTNSNGTNILNFSGEFKKAYDNKNYTVKMDLRQGMDSPFESGRGGEGLFMQNEIAYGYFRANVIGKHILYVPTETANTVEAKKAAVQKKIDDFAGKGKIIVKEATVGDTVNEPVTATPGTPEYEEFIYYMTGLEGVTLDTPCFVAEINGVNRYFMVECDSSKMVEATPYHNKDVITDVSVFSKDNSIPLDTYIRVDKMTGGDVYNKIIRLLGVTDDETYDINLYSEAAGKYITKLANGKFEVRIPVPEKFKNMKLTVYHVDNNNKITTHSVTVEKGYAVFFTDHFSIYTLAKASDSLNDQTPLPGTGDISHISTGIVLALSMLALCGIGIALRNNRFKKEG